MTDPSEEHNGQPKTSYFERFTHPFVFLWVGALTFTLFIDPVAAAETSDPIMTTVENATAWLTGIGPAVGTLNAGFNMMKASGTNKSGKKKEYKENIRSSLMYGWGLGMLMGITSLITRWTGVGM
jgi:hypothetical protein